MDTYRMDTYYTDPDYERENFTFLANQTWAPNPVFVDVGAHQGTYTTFLAKLAGPGGLVHAFEPDPRNLLVLADRVAHHKDHTTYHKDHAPVVLYPMALGALTGAAPLQCWFTSTRGATGNSQLVQGNHGDFAVTVVVRSLDSFRLPRVDFIKIDVEHLEWDVLYGCRWTLTFHKPRLLIEVHDPTTYSPGRVFFDKFCRDNQFTYTEQQATHPNQNHGTYFWVVPTKSL